MKHLYVTLLSALFAYLYVYYLKTTRRKAITSVVILHDVTDEFHKLGKKHTQ